VALSVHLHGFAGVAGFQSAGYRPIPSTDRGAEPLDHATAGV